VVPVGLRVCLLVCVFACVCLCVDFHFVGFFLLGLRRPIIGGVGL